MKTLGWVAYDGWHGLDKSELQLLRRSADNSSTTVVIPACPQISDMTLGHQFLTIAPVLPGGWVLLGEVGKIATISRRRFQAVTTTAAIASKSTWTPTVTDSDINIECLTTPLISTASSLLHHVGACNAILISKAESIGVTE